MKMFKTDCTHVCWRISNMDERLSVKALPYFQPFSRSTRDFNFWAVFWATRHIRMGFCFRVLSLAKRRGEYSSEIVEAYIKY